MKLGQVWVETVVYTLIGLGLIAITLTLITPKINEFRDKSTIEQSIASLNAMDSKINDVLSGGIGNARTVEFNMKRGILYFDKENESIRYVLEDSKIVFSEPGVEVGIGKIRALTQEGVKEHQVSLKVDYRFDLDFDEENPAVFVQSAVPYKFRFENGGFAEDGRQKIIFKEA